MESLVKGPPLRECVFACGGVVNRGGGAAEYNRNPLSQKLPSNRQKRRERVRETDKKVNMWEDMKICLFLGYFLLTSQYSVGF